MKKKALSEQVPSEQVISNQEIEEQNPEESPYYSLGKWGGMEQWNCRFCPWDTLEGEEAALMHYLERHAAQAAPVERPKPAGGLLIANRFGNEI